MKMSEFISSRRLISGQDQNVLEKCFMIIFET